MKIANHPQPYDRLGLCCLTPEQHARTCDYWYLVQSCGMAHTAFHTRAAMLRWLDDRGLSVDVAAIPPHGEHAYLPISGAYRKVSHGAPSALRRLRGKRVRLLDNAEYTQAVITADPDGLRTVHYLNCNLDRPVYDYAESRKMEQL